MLLRLDWIEDPQLWGSREPIELVEDFSGLDEIAKQEILWSQSVKEQALSTRPTFYTNCSAYALLPPTSPIEVFPATTVPRWFKFPSCIYRRCGWLQLTIILGTAEMISVRSPKLPVYNSELVSYVSFVLIQIWFTPPNAPIPVVYLLDSIFFPRSTLVTFFGV